MAAHHSDVYILSRDSLGPTVQRFFSKPWLVQFEDGTILEYDTEHGARELQRKWRIAHDLDPITGDPSAADQVHNDREATLLSVLEEKNASLKRFLVAQVLEAAALRELLLEKLMLKKQ
ncbi:hypothetical protein JQ621_24445 [Bradyrhizobium manausense]|uniref:hypothetical protein n=1 Tax=Bradyrhizobium manausense TaxID=989370 RepID=UPI001BA92B91|nr:hypothetical protein [Bradyrhizobium manausense]MBR1090628.1 hypothetical protein [Bradyrhizobium manausense]